MRRLFLLLATLTPIMGVLSSETSVADGSVTAPQWRQDAILKVRVSFEVKQRRLVDLLRDLQQQSGIALVTDDEMRNANLLVTARVQDKELADVMASFARLYAAQWTKKSDKEYILGNRLHGLERALYRQGSILMLEGGYSNMSPDPRYTWVKPTWQHLGGQQKQVLVSSLPSEIQARLRTEIERNASSQMVDKSQKALIRSLEENRIRIKVVAPRVVLNGKVQPFDPRQQSLYVEVLDPLRVPTGVIFTIDPPKPEVPAVPGQ